jgi:hypothetical protein
MTDQSTPAIGCCPPFDPATLDGKTHIWQDKLFISDTVPQFFHIPLPGAVLRTVVRMWDAAQAARAVPKRADFLMLACDRSPWTLEWYMSVSAPVPGAAEVRLSGTFLSKVFDGPNLAVPKWRKAMENYAAARGHTVEKHYFYYATCPKCAKLYGHNYVVAFARIG